jgi:hypothetical protein
MGAFFCIESGDAAPQLRETERENHATLKPASRVERAK